MFDQIRCKIRLEYGQLCVLNGSNLVMKGIRKNGVYIFDGEVISGEAGVSGKSTEDKTKIWHLRLEHISAKGLKELEHQGMFGSNKIGKLEFCEVCVLRKSLRGSFKRSSQKLLSRLEYAHTDLWGPAQNVSLRGSIYFLSIIDDLSRKV